MSEVSKNEQLIHALLDGELDDVRAQKVRQMLSTDEQLTKCYDDCLAQREALAALTRFKLPDDFSSRILQVAQKTPSVSQSHRQPEQSTVPVSLASTSALSTTGGSKLSIWQIAATAILSSAATLLITTFLLPTDWADHGPVVAKSSTFVQSQKSTAGPSVAIDTEDAESISTDESMVASALTEPPIEQVWLLEAQDNQSGVKLARALAANSIQVPAELSGETDDELTDTLDQEINGILIEASAIQMKKALLELADSEQFEISAFTLPGHEAYFADIHQAKNVDSDSPEKTKEEDAPVVASADQLAAEAIASAAASRIEGRLMQPPITMAQQLLKRRFSKKKTAATVSISDRKKTLFADGVYSDADGPEGLGASAAPLFDVDESPRDEQNVEKQNVEALFPKNQQSGEPKGNYLLLIRTAPQ